MMEMESMKINPADHLYARQVTSHFRNERFNAPNAIGMADHISLDTIPAKSSSLRDELAKFDLRNISPSELGKLASMLFEAGETSDNAASRLISARVDFKNQDEPVDIIKFFENRFSIVNENLSNDLTYSNSRKIYSDTLHTIYNLDTFTRGSRESIGINLKA